MSGLAVSGVTHDHGARRALDEVSFRITPGRFCALLGPNGAGKSTLFSLLTRLTALQAGRIEIDGQEMARARARRWPESGWCSSNPRSTPTCP